MIKILYMVIVLIGTNTQSSAEEVENRINSCLKGNAKVCYQLGRLYSGGQAVEKDNAKATKFYRKACDNNASLCTIIGSIQEGVQDNLSEVFYFYTEACDKGDMRGCSRLADMYKKDQDFPTAIKLYTQACNAGYGHSCFGLAYMYLRKQGVDRNISKANNFFNKACNLNVDQCFGLGNMYMRGEGVRQDYSRAKDYYLKSCNGGSDSSNAISCTWLGIIYHYGKGTKVDMNKAKAFYGKACDGGNDNGCKGYADLNNE